ncbi:conserved hypothetical protein [Culex quinquefasciatus]|uniref:Leucine-rich immune protein (Coil-less) n=1 Tax=Culex quinquefasciatus TaxID=7176 RepID=B0WBV5_CULQU|nr:conserved hypothetical protein [Culex quinquefasciatus]|eukprot:XP_001846189.1 conserved hypothetical protein [Culex quinquefasciatus]
MKALAFLICLFVVTLAADEETSKTLYFNEIESESDASKINFPNLKELSMIKCKINNLTMAMLYQLTNADKFTFIWGFVKVASMTPQFKYFAINQASIIARIRFFSIRTTLRHCQHISTFLKNLAYFRIEHNQIESVNAEDFNGLNKLKHMSLAYNRIARLSSSPAHPTVLPELYHFFLNENLLRNVSFADWSAPKLKQLHLNSNQLAIAQSVLEPFPKLQLLSVVKNPLNCGWLNFLKNEARAKNVYLEEYARCKETGESMEELIERIKRE